MHSVPDPSRVRFTGPVAPFAPGLVEDLASFGYTTTSATMQMQLAASLSRWLLAAGIGLDALTEPVMQRFLSERRVRRTSHYSLRRWARSWVTCGGLVRCRRWLPRPSRWAGQRCCWRGSPPIWPGIGR